MISRKYRSGVFLLLLLAGLTVAGFGQRNPFPFPSSQSSSENVPPFGPSRNVKMLKESFAKTQEDVAQLYELVTELKQEMDKANEDVLSITVMKKAEEIEKLAEKIKNRMKNL